MATTKNETKGAIAQATQAVADGNLTQSALDNLSKWLTEPRYDDYAQQVIEHIEAGKWQALDDAFWTVIPFGTGGRRGRMYPIGSNAINDRTIGESAQGLASYVKDTLTKENLSCAIAYDTRHRSRHFAELCAGIMVANGFKVYFLDDYRSTPELSYMVRYKQCDCGIMVTASHNPPSDNAVKVYWSTGGQVLPPHDAAIIDRVMSVNEIEVADFEEAVGNGKVEVCTEEVDRAFFDCLERESFGGPRDIKIIYSPLHGVGTTAVEPLMAKVGFNDCEVYGPHAEPSGDFPNVPNNVSNPENAEVFDDIIAHAKEVGASIIMASDPDCDRLGCAVPVTTDSKGEWTTLNGNEIGALLTDFVLEQRSKAGKLNSDAYVIKTLVTTEMVRRIADSYNVRTEGDLLVGFKWIGGRMDEVGTQGFMFATEESHGYMVGDYVRDKDGAVACLTMAELAAHVNAQGKSVYEKLEDLHWQHGYHGEKLISIYMEGSEGMARMKALMQLFREDPPKTLAGIPVAAVRDYGNKTRTEVGGSVSPLNGPEGNLIFLDLAAEGNYVAVRPSGTEPKVKFYMFTYTAPEQLADLQMTRDEMQERITQFEADLRAFAARV